MFASGLPTGDDDEEAAELTIPATKNLVTLAKMLDEKEVNSTAGKDIFAEMLKTDQDPMEIAKAKNLLQVSDSGAVEKIVDEVIADPAYAKAVADYKAGQDKVIGFLVGQVMKHSHGKANPSLAREILVKKLKA